MRNEQRIKQEIKRCEGVFRDIEATEAEFPEDISYLMKSAVQKVVLRHRIRALEWVLDEG